MANTILLTNGRIETIFNERDFLELVDECMGSDAREWLEEHLAEKDGDANYVTYLEKEADRFYNVGSPEGKKGAPPPSGGHGSRKHFRRQQDERITAGGSAPAGSSLYEGCDPMGGYSRTPGADGAVSRLHGRAAEAGA